LKTEWFKVELKNKKKMGWAKAHPINLSAL